MAKKKQAVEKSNAHRVQDLLNGINAQLYESGLDYVTLLGVIKVAETGLLMMMRAQGERIIEQRSESPKSNRPDYVG